MSRKYISQRESHRLLMRVQILETERAQQRSNWTSEYPGGDHLGNLIRKRDWFSGRLEAAQLLGHAIVAKIKDDGTITFYALKQAK